MRGELCLVEQAVDSWSGGEQEEVDQVYLKPYSQYLQLEQKILKQNYHQVISSDS